MNTIFNNEKQQGESFSITYNSTLLTVYEKPVNGHIVFVVLFPEIKTPLLLTRALRENGEKFWTSIPEGRQQEAGAIGPLVASAILKQQ